MRLRDLVQAGEVTKARNPFALYMADTFKEVRSECATRQQAMTQVAVKWKKLPAAKRDAYTQKAQEERTEQQRQIVQLGVRVRMNKWRVPCNAPETEPLPQLPGQFGEFQIVQGKPILGGGTFGRVVQVSKASTGQRFVMKIFIRDPENIEDELLVYRALGCLGQPGRAPFLECIAHDCFGPLTWLVTPYIDGPAHKHAPLRTHEELQAFTAQVLGGLMHLHAIGIVHMDIKPANLLWRALDHHAFIIDFGCCERWPKPIHETTHSKGSYVTELYRPPEIWNASSPVPRTLLAPAVDLWCLGCTVFEMAYGAPLFRPAPNMSVRNHVSQYMAARIPAAFPRWLKVRPYWRRVCVSLCAPTAAVRERSRNALVACQNNVEAVEWLANAQ